MGIPYFEISHLYTQWGARYAPKVMATVDGEYRRIFGWETDALGEEYTAFLNAFMPELTAFLHAEGIMDRCFFHVSDEPSPEHNAQYNAAKQVLTQYVKEEQLIDALSAYELYESGAVRHPVVSNDHAHHFMEKGVTDLWTYYCCAQTAKVPNRFFNFPSLRSRIMGVLMYIYDIAGFLQWGYNFWYSRRSEKLDIDPFRVTDADRAFPSGDAFMVYPGSDGPVDSIRHEIMREALQDLRALKKLESFIGREKTVEFIHADLDYQLSMTDYPRSAEWLLDLRERVNYAIKNAVCK